METAARPHIIVTEGVNDDAMRRLQDASEVSTLPRCDQAALLEAVRQADALVIRTYSEITPEIIAEAARAGRLKVIGRAGVGLDNVDVPAALAAGIAVVHTPAASTIAVAELVVGFVVAMQRRVVELDRKLRGGEFAALRKGMPKNMELRHQTLGVIGMGRVGRAVSTQLHHGLGMRVIYHDIREVGWLPFVAEPRPSAEEVYAEADVVTMHVPLTARTRGMVNAAALARFKPGAYLVNTSRGPVVDAAALAAALQEGRLAGAAIDVYDPEPPPADHPLLAAPNCILTPHIASRTFEALTAMNDVVDDVIAVLQGRPPRHPADPDVL